MMRVAYVSVPFGPAAEPLVRAVAARPDVDVACVLAAFSGQRQTPADLDVEWVRYRRVRQKFAWTTVPNLRRTLDALRPDVVHIHGEPWSLVALQAVARRHAPTVVHGAETLYDQGGRVEASLRRAMSRRVLGRLDGFVGWARRTVDAAHRYGLAASVPTCAVPGIVPEVALFDAARRSRSRTRDALGLDGTRTVVFVGRLVEQKGLRWLGRAFDRISDADLRLVIVGGGPLDGWVDDWATTDDRVRALGRLDAAAVASTIAAADCLVVPSLTTDRWEEQFGRVVAEACFAGTPSVVSSSGALPEVVGPSGRVVPENDDEALAAAIVDVARPREVAPDGSDAALAFGTASYHPDVVADRLATLWSEVVGRQGRTDRT